MLSFVQKEIRLATETEAPPTEEIAEQRSTFRICVGVSGNTFFPGALMHAKGYGVIHSFVRVKPKNLRVINT